MSAGPEFLRTIERLKADRPISTVIGETLPLERRGREFVARCPFHSERSPSFTVVDASGFFHCFGCGEHGDVFDWLDRARGMSLSEAVKYLTGESDGNDRPVRIAPQAVPPAVESIWIPIVPVPVDAPRLLRGDGRTVELVNPKRAGELREHISFAPVACWPYLDAARRLLGYVIRVELARDGRAHKITPQITFCQGPNGGHRWCMVPFPEPRPLYGLEALAERPDAPVLIPEGEKACDAGRRLLPGFVVATWPGGSKAIHHVDWFPLAGRDVLLLPDADQPGRDAVEGRTNESGERVSGIAELLAPIAKRVRMVDPPAGLLGGWDIADAEGWSEADALSWLLAHIRMTAVETSEATPIEPELSLDGAPPDLAKWLPLLGRLEGEARGRGAARLSSYLLRHFCDPSLVVGLAADWNAVHCRPPLPTPDLVSLVERCAAWGVERRARRRGRQ